jgi:hypothetical protein
LNSRGLIVNRVGDVTLWSAGCHASGPSTTQIAGQNKLPSSISSLINQAENVFVDEI